MPDEKIGHTPGPWKIVLHADDNPSNLPMIMGPGDRKVCDFGWDDENEGGAGDPPLGPDLHLMAAAPELLAECKRALCAFTAIADWREAVADQIADDDCPYQGLASAIAKATGRS